jgi:small nuclear ribonucleoprotein (snRNP)-like protein
MENVKGPIALLYKFKNNKTRVKIYLRKEHGVRGFVTGFITAFDKHLNILLVECVEQWKRRKYKFSENKVALLSQPKDCTEVLLQMGIEIPKVTTKSIDRKNVQCSRLISQLMVRGEEVILISEDKIGEL